MGRRLTPHGNYLRRVESLALSTVPVPDGLLAAAPTHHDGAMVALIPDAPEDLALSSEKALPAPDLHVTLCYLGKAKNLDIFKRSEILRKTQRVCNDLGHPFTTKAEGVVVMGSNDEGVPATAWLIQSDEIVELYDNLCEALAHESTYPSFIPHMTTGYGVPLEEAQERLGEPVRFSSVVVKFGDETHTISLNGALVAAPRGANVIDRVIDSLGRLWDEALHPRGGDGRFIKKNGAISGKLSVPTPDRKGVTTIDASRASVVGFHTFDNDVWVLAEVQGADGSKVQGFAKAMDVKATAPIKARLDALYPVDTAEESAGAAAIERGRQIDLIMAHINQEYLSKGDGDGAMDFLSTLGLSDADLDDIFGENEDYDPATGLKVITRRLNAEELDEAADIIDDAQKIKRLRDRVHGLIDADTITTPKSNVTIAGGDTLYRGMTITLDTDDMVQIQELLELPMEESQIDQHFKIGPIILDRLRQGDRGLGNNWTVREEMADTAVAMSREGNLQVKITGKLQSVDDVQTDPAKLVDVSGDEGEVRLIPGTEPVITDVQIKDGLNWRSVLSPSEVEPNAGTHTVPEQRLLRDSEPSTSGEAVGQLAAGEDPLTVQSSDLLAAMEASGRFTQPEQIDNTGISPISWRIDDDDQTDVDVYLAGTGQTTTGRAYFVKQSVIGADMGNTDIVKEVLASLIAEQLAESIGPDDERLLPIPKSVFGDNPVWDGGMADDTGLDFNDPFAPMPVHQPAHVVSSHAEYTVPGDWDKTTLADEEAALSNDIRGLDPAGKVDVALGHYEDMGDIYGNDIARMVLWDFLTLNGDRNLGNAILASPPDSGQGRVLPFDHGAAFDENPLGDDAETSEVFKWFMNYSLTKPWLNYVRGGADLNNNVTEDSLRRVIDDFNDVYSQISVEEILSRFRAMPNVSDAQVAAVEKSLKGVVDRAAWMRDNMEMILQQLTVDRE